ncbi:coiled-coil domain-containing protein [Sedimentitalea todarodis]|uniref:Chromosome partition protein Smc n=1 Tax=Sedimentitalea todarodis TaxID=1631240 RepID=A0ABU3VK14_9RHOB|nr:hypothetical protein [Sedimentitalea todarodis]MDU9006533.1 hypothetical protein [Sedimentitalea todarodis]
MTLAILNLSGLDEAGWRPWFETVLPANTDWQVAEDPDDLPAADRYVLIYDAPDTRFLRAMQEGAPFGQIIADWTEHARQVLARWRKARRRLYLVDADAFAAAPEMLAESLGGWLGCDMGTPPAGDRDAEVHPLAILAAQAAHCLDPVRQLADELEVGGISPRLARQGSAARLGAAYAAWQAQAAAAEKSAARNRQLDKAKAKTKAVQADRTRARREVKALSAKLQEVTAKTDRLQAELKTRKDAIKAEQAEDARKRIETLTARLETAVAEADRLRADLKAQKDTAKTAQAGEAKTRHEVEALTAQLQQATAEASRLDADQTAEKEAAQALFHEEIELLQQQLMTVQQALEQEYRDGLALRKAAGSDRHQLRSDLDRMRRAAELEQLRLSTMLQEQAEQIAALLEEQRTLTTELDRSREEVDGLLASTSWRMTAPLRRARLVVAKPT